MPPPGIELHAIVAVSHSVPLGRIPHDPGLATGCFEPRARPGPGLAWASLGRSEPRAVSDDGGLAGEKCQRIPCAKRQ